MKEIHIPEVEVYKSKCTDEKHWENILIHQRCIKCGAKPIDAELVLEAQRLTSERN